MSTFRRTCPQCGKETRTVGDFCPYCTAELPQTYRAVAEKRRRKSGMKKVITTISFLLIVGIFFLVSCQKPAPTTGETTTEAETSVTTETEAAETEATETEATTEAAETTAETIAETEATTAATVNIPTDGEMQILFGFDKIGVKPVFSGSDIPWEPAKWQLQWVDSTPLSLLLLEDWEFTVTRSDNVVAVYYGDGVTKVDIKGASMRYLPAYNTPGSLWAQNKAEMLKRERDFGLSRDPAYETIAGNFEPAATTPTLETSTLINAEWLETNIGGQAKYWVEPSFEGGAWVFKNKEHFVSLEYPGVGILNVWIKKATSIDSSNSELLLGKKFDEASYTP